MIFQVPHVFEKECFRSLGLDDSGDYEKHVSPILIALCEASFMPSLTERLAWESCAKDVVIWHARRLYLQDIIIEKCWVCKEA